jgi:ABC-2 type transport system permease protein/lipopolysaccharide transport system permease protein
MSSTQELDAPPPELLFKRRVRLRSALPELWRARVLIRTLAERDLRVRYKLAVLGFIWAVLSPFILMVVFSLFFQRIASIDTQGVPYALFAYLGLIPWAFFSSSVSSGGMNILANTALMNKVYCPREVFPIAGVAVTAVDTAMSVLVLVLVFAVYTFAPPLWALLWIPVFLAVLVAFSLGVTLFVSAAVVYFRDLRQAIPMILQLGLFATPVAYGMDLIPQRFRLVYVILDPIAAVIDGLRRTLLFHTGPDMPLLLAAGVSSLVFLFLGYTAFKKLETRFADVA